MNQYLQIFLIIFSVQLVFFLFASLFKTDKFTDLAYGLTFVIVSIYLLIVNQSYLVQHLIMAMITLWGVRLAGYLFIRILKIKKDKRFDGIRENFFKFGSFWLLQSIAIFVIMLPSIIILISQKDYFFTTLSYIGILMWYFGFKIETVADKQKFKFKNVKNVKIWTPDLKCG